MPVMWGSDRECEGTPRWMVLAVALTLIVATVIAIGAGAGAEARLTATIDARAAQGEQ